MDYTARTSFLQPVTTPRRGPSTHEGLQYLKLDVPHTAAFPCDHLSTVLGF